MKDDREPLRKGTCLQHEKRTFVIDSVVGRGSNAIVYAAAYPDTLQPEMTHRVLIKELFPYEESGKVYRMPSGEITWPQDADDFVSLHRESFLRGNAAHLKLLSACADRIGANLDSFSANHTCYTVLGYSDSCTLAEFMRTDGRELPFSVKLRLFCRILDAVTLLHTHRMLHLDIAPDNILVFPAEQTDVEGDRRMVLIDYNSVWEFEELTGHTGKYFSIKDSYSAPEIRMRDQRSIGISSDLFSVCSVFYEILCGVPLTWEQIYDSLAGEPVQQIRKAMREQPEPVARQMVRMLKKGLRIVPNQRYLSTDELRAAILEIERLAQMRGISHGTIWEASARRFRSNYANVFPEKLLPMCIADADETMEASEYLHAHAGKENLFLTGEGGSGKTTLLRAFWEENVRHYRVDYPAVVYIPLSSYTESERSETFIRTQILKGILPQEDGESAAQTMKKLNEWMCASKPVLLLLLDGWNEAGSKRAPLISEIRELCGMSGVRVLTTGRSVDCAAQPFDRFRVCSVQPLDRAVVARRLEKTGSEVSEENLEILRNPLMLYLFTGSADHPQAETRLSLHDLVLSYLETLKAKARRTNAASTELQLRTDYVIDYLFGAVCTELQHRHAVQIGIRQLLKIVARNFRMLHSRELSVYAPQYMGMARKITDGAQNETEWFACAVTKLLVSELGLLQQTETNAFRIRHQDLIEPAAEQYAQRTKKIRRRRLEKRIGAGAAAAVIVAITAGGLRMAVHRQRPDVQMTQAQPSQKMPQQILSALLLSAGNVGMDIEEMNVFLESDAVIQAADSAEADRDALLLQAQTAADHIASNVSSRTADYYLQSLPQDGTVLSEPLFTALYDAPSVFGEQTGRILFAVSERLSGNMSKADRQKMIEACRTYLSLHAQQNLIQTQMFLVDEDPQDLITFLNAYAKMPGLGEVYVRTKWERDPTVLQTQLDSVQDQIRMNESQMKVLGCFPTS